MFFGHRIFESRAAGVGVGRIDGLHVEVEKTGNVGGGLFAWVDEMASEPVIDLTHCEKCNVWYQPQLDRCNCPERGPE